MQEHHRAAAAAGGLTHCGTASVNFVLNFWRPLAPAASE